MMWPRRAAPETWAFLVLGGLALLVTLQPVVAVSRTTLVISLAIAVVLTGLPHGALDPFVAWRAGLWRTRLGFVAFHLGYMGTALAVMGLWQLAPGASLGGFLAISAWHFGGDWQPELGAWMRPLSGLALLSLPAVAAPAEVSAIFALLSGDQGRVLAGWLSELAPWLAVITAGLALRVLPRSPATAIELVVAGALALLLPPLVFFLVYFCALPSPRDLRLAARAADSRQRRRMAVVALVYTALTVVAGAVAWYWLAGDAASANAPDAQLLKILFIGLAALTWPHMALIFLSERRRRIRP